MLGSVFHGHSIFFFARVPVNQTVRTVSRLTNRNQAVIRTIFNRNQCMYRVVLPVYCASLFSDFLFRSIHAICEAVVILPPLDLPTFITESAIASIYPFNFVPAYFLSGKIHLIVHHTTKWWGSGFCCCGNWWRCCLRYYSGFVEQGGWCRCNCCGCGYLTILRVSNVSYGTVAIAVIEGAN